MGIAIDDYPMVQRRLEELGCSPLTKIAILPENFGTAPSSVDFRQRSEADTVRKLLRMNNIQADFIKTTNSTPYIQNNSMEWVAPAIFIGAGVVSDNSSIVSLAIGVLTNYLTEFFKGGSGSKRVKLEIVVEKQADRTCKNITYDGDLEGLSALPAIIKQLSHE